MVYKGEKAIVKSSVHELDDKDRKLLYLLTKNARLQNKDLAQATGLSPDTVKYRIDKMTKNKVITGFTVVFNRHKIGYDAVDIYCSVQNLSDKLIMELMTNPDVYWLATANGPFNLCLSTNAEGMEDIQKLIAYLRRTTKIYRMICLPLYYEHTTTHEYLMEGIVQRPVLRNFRANEVSFEKEFIERKHTSSNIRILSNVERAVMDLLIRDCRTPLYDIAIKIHRSIETVKRIIAGLVREDIIIQFEPKISTPLLGYYWGLIFVRLKDPADRMDSPIVKYVKLQPYGHWFSYVIGDYDLILSLHTKNKSEFEKIASDLKSRFINCVDHIENITLKQQFKHMNLFLRRKPI